MEAKPPLEVEVGPLVDERCECGNLLCKISETTIEIKCRRCKRIHVIPIEKLGRSQSK